MEKQIIHRLKTACENAGQNITDHFADVSKMIPMPKGASKKVNDYMLPQISPSFWPWPKRGGWGVSYDL